MVLCKSNYKLIDLQNKISDLQVTYNMLELKKDRNKHHELIESKHNKKLLLKQEKVANKIRSLREKMSSLTS